MKLPLRGGCQCGAVSGAAARIQRLEREKAELRVEGKVIKTTGAGVKDARKAAEQQRRGQEEAQ